MRRWSLAPEFAPGVMEIFAKWKNLRIMRIARMDRLESFVGAPYVDFKSLIDGGIIAQTAFVPEDPRRRRFSPAAGHVEGQGIRVSSGRRHRRSWTTCCSAGSWRRDHQQLRDLREGRGHRRNRHRRAGPGGRGGNRAGQGVPQARRPSRLGEFPDAVCGARKARGKGGDRPGSRPPEGRHRGACMVSDGFFPFRDGVDVGIREGVTAIVQPGGSDRDFESIEACNEAGVAMVYTGQRSFKH